jgi:hypothetical protein
MYHDSVTRAHPGPAAYAFWREVLSNVIASWGFHMHYLATTTQAAGTAAQVPRHLSPATQPFSWCTYSRQCLGSRIQSAAMLPSSPESRATRYDNLAPSRYTSLSPSSQRPILVRRCRAQPHRPLPFPPSRQRRAWPDLLDQSRDPTQTQLYVHLGSLSSGCS